MGKPKWMLSSLALTRCAVKALLAAGFPLIMPEPQSIQVGLPSDSTDLFWSW